MKDRNKKIILGVTIAALLILVLGVTYAAYTFTNSGSNQELVVGDIYMHYKEGERQISIPEAIPSSTYDESKYFEFTIDGKNTYTEKDIWYEIDLSYGDPPEDVNRTERIKDKLLKFTLTETKDGVTTKVVDGASYKDLQGKKLWVNKIEKGTDAEVNITYKLYMWISDKTIVGNTEDADYSTDVWNDNVFASIKIDVKGDFIPKEIDEPLKPLNEIILKKAYTGGSDKESPELIAIDVSDKSNIKKCESVEACAGKKIEYRYIGPNVNNYIYLKNDQEENELWRIIGLFQNDDGTDWNVKVVRDEVLPSSYLPYDYTINNVTINGSILNVEYTVKYPRGNESYWNKNDSGTQLNRWEESGLQYFLNTDHDDSSSSERGYLSYLSKETKSLLVEKNYYLGTVQSSNGPYATPKEAYEQERKVTGCVNGKGTASSWDDMKDTECLLFLGNAATWKGKVGLMYPSDYGLSASEDYWSTIMGSVYDDSTSFKDAEVKETTWMYNTMTDSKSEHSWFLSPSTSLDIKGSNKFNVHFLTNSGYVYDTNASYGTNSVRPTLYLSSKTTKFSGEGTSESPYVILDEKN